MHIAIWGNELIAWTAAAAFAEYGNQIHINSDAQIPRSLSQQSEQNNVLFNEPGLLHKVKQHYDQGQLLCGQLDEALACPIQIIALAPDKLELAQQLLGLAAERVPFSLLVINYATFGLGATDQLNALLDIKRDQVIAYIPDNLSEGNAYERFTQTDTLVIGCQSSKGIQLIQALYKPFSRHLNQLLPVKTHEAEFMKFASNGMLALRLGYINELANLADQLDIDIDTILAGLGSDPRIGKHYLSPGCGFGGSYFSKTIESMAELLKTNRNSIILNTLIEENEKQKTRPFRKLWQHYKTDVAGKKIAVWGLSFKPNTASIQNAPSLNVVKTLLAQGCEVHAHDPQAILNFSQEFPANGQIVYHEKALDALQEADALLILTEWNEYWSPDYAKMLKLMKQPVIIDGRNILEKTLLRDLGFTYYGMGR